MCVILEGLFLGQSNPRYKTHSLSLNATSCVEPSKNKLIKAPRNKYIVLPAKDSINIVMVLNRLEVFE